MLWYLLCLPRNLFGELSYSTVVYDKGGELLGARIAGDGQWRFPRCDTVPHKFATAIVQFEDRMFYDHYGVNPLSLGRALLGNIREGKVTSGGSTITMQVIRLSRKGRSRNLKEKIIEAILATRLEARYSKSEILALYASHAPFGGNIVGLEAAAWRYFGRRPSELSWAETATLAVLPNSPSHIHPGKNREELLRKRNSLLDRLLKIGALTEEEHYLACEEPLVLEPKALPSYVPHLVDYYNRTSAGQAIHTDIDLGLQSMIDRRMTVWNEDFSSTGIKDLAAVVIDVRSGQILAYCGNASPGNRREGAMVDIPRAPRSTGSVLKPFLYCAALQDGIILPGTLLPDIPLNVNGFSPRNFDLQFYGAVPADQALARSLNVPAVNMLKDYGVPQFHQILRDCGMTSLTRTADEYGLSLILGGAEGFLLEITGIYATMSRVYQYGAEGRDKDFPLTDRIALWHTFEALKELGRPDEIDLRLVRSVRKAAWKTGTSWGFRDGWAVGVTPEYAVGVWAGNAKGDGVPGLVGARTAGPVMFDIFNLLPSAHTSNNYASDGWFLEPLPAEGLEAEVCRNSGYLRGANCPDADTLLLPRASMNTRVCPYHPGEDGEFVLPPAMEWYYRQHHPEYKKIKKGGNKTMEFIYPENRARITLPKQLDGTRGNIVFNLAHREAGSTVWWHLDDEYLGQTQDIHQMSLSPEPGTHHLTVVDNGGNECSIYFVIAF